jgi:hypothetical protein
MYFAFSQREMHDDITVNVPDKIKAMSTCTD